MHPLGGIAITYFFSRALTILQKSGLVGAVDQRVRTVLLFALTATAAVFWEFGEFLVDHFFGTRMQRGLEDTLLDMFLGIVGGVGYLSAGALGLVSREKQTNAPDVEEKKAQAAK